MAITSLLTTRNDQTGGAFKDINLCCPFRLGSTLHLRLKINHKSFFLIVLVLSCVNWLFFLILYEVFYEAAVLSTQRNYCPPKSALFSKVVWFILKKT